MHGCEQKSVEWLNRRKYALTASKFASILGQSTYPGSTRADYMSQYVGVGRDSATRPPEQKYNSNVATLHGERYEDEAIDRFERERGKTVLHFGLMPFIGGKDTFLAGSVDGITSDGWLVEVKCPFMKRTISPRVPDMYVAQVQGMMHGFNLKSCHFVQYVPDLPASQPGRPHAPPGIRYHDLPRDDVWMKQYWVELREFWYRMLQARSEADRGLLRPPKPQRAPKRKRISVCGVLRDRKARVDLPDDECMCPDPCQLHVLERSKTSGFFLHLGKLTGNVPHTTNQPKPQVLSTLVDDTAG